MSFFFCLIVRRAPRSNLFPYTTLFRSGQLIVHGVALRSSRAEPFGERFLRRALFCTMTGDVVGVRNAYLETADKRYGHPPHRQIGRAHVRTPVTRSSRIPFSACKKQNG